MGFFGKSEDELKQIAATLEKWETVLHNLESDIKGKETNLAHDRNLLTTDKGKFEIERSNSRQGVQAYRRQYRQPRTQIWRSADLKSH